MKSRRQFGALPYRFSDGRAEILLITSRTRRRWIIPKGNPMKERSAAEAAEIEAYEEAGVRGEITPEAFGSYAHGVSSRRTVEVFLLRVEKVLDEYPEAHQRQRRWFSPQEAADRVYEEDLKELLLRIEAALGS